MSVARGCSSVLTTIRFLDSHGFDESEAVLSDVAQSRLDGIVALTRKPRSQGTRVWAQEANCRVCLSSECMMMPRKLKISPIVVETNAKTEAMSNASRTLFTRRLFIDPDLGSRFIRHIHGAGMNENLH